jgi:hypothetical protein
MAAVSRFVSRLGEKVMPLYKFLKKVDKFVWTDDADAALQVLKNMMSTQPILTAPYSQEPMLMYMEATNRLVNVVMVVERKEEAQVYIVKCPAYYLSEVFTESKKHYPHYQKLAYDVFLTARKL